MSLIARRFRGVLIAIVVLGLSASAVFAANVLPQLTGAFSAGATTAQHEGSAADEEKDEAPDADEDATEDTDASEADADDPATIGNHGSFVSQAAHMATPAGFRNHGAFVSCVAHIKDVPADTAAFFAALKATDCQRAQADEDASTSTSTDADGPKKDKAAKVKHGHGRGHTK